MTIRGCLDRGTIDPSFSDEGEKRGAGWLIEDRDAVIKAWCDQKEKGGEEGNCMRNDAKEGELGGFQPGRA